MCDKHNKVTFKSCQFEVINLKTKKNTLSRSRVRNVRAINFDHVDSRNLACFRVVNDDVWLWHKRLGCDNMRIIEKLPRYDLIRGPSKHKYDKNQVCSACVKQKQCRASLNPPKIVSTSNALELLHMDLYGPIRLKMLAGSKYIYVVVDD